MIKKNGFTLAEVLMVLTIIGVIAAMTIPNMVADYNKKAFGVLYLKTFGMLEDIISVSEIDNETSEDWDYSLGATEFFNKYLRDKLRITKTCAGTAGCIPGQYVDLVGDEWGGFDIDRHNVVLSDGVILSFVQHSATCVAENKTCYTLFVDLNGTKGPGVMGLDLHYFNIYAGGFGIKPWAYYNTCIYNTGETTRYSKDHIDNCCTTDKNKSCSEFRRGATCGAKILAEGGIKY